MYINISADLYVIFVIFKQHGQIFKIRIEQRLWYFEIATCFLFGIIVSTTHGQIFGFVKSLGINAIAFEVYNLFYIRDPDGIVLNDFLFQENILQLEWIKIS